MTHQKWRLPAGLPTPRRIPLPGEAMGSADLFASATALADLLVAAAAPPHPDYLARSAIWRDHEAGLISLEEATRRSADVGRAAAERQKRREGPPPPRRSRPAPRESRQYAGAMATTLARDDRLTPNSKALGHVLRARCGNGRRTEITKATMGDVLSRSTRSIRRYLADLQALGYIEIEIRRDSHGRHTGLIITLTDAMMPFYEEPKGLARWLAETPKALLQPFETVSDPTRARVTKLSPINQSHIHRCRLRRFPLSKEARSGADPPR